MEDSRRWAARGTATFLGAMATLPDPVLEREIALPGWTGKHLLAHVAANAEALMNLVAWARTGVETPMYASPEQRDADIESGARRPAGELRSWVADSAAALDLALAAMRPDDWPRAVRTAQGRAVEATEIPWMRAREVMIHAVDLGAGVRFADLPFGFLAALVDDIVAKRSHNGPAPTANDADHQVRRPGDGPALALAATDHHGRWLIDGAGERTTVHGTLAGIAAYLAGRDTDGVRDAPPLPRWL
ncbi:maleylpyruvate isomerase family mycothiol-dependent enzyme [Actinoplanes sp. CA-054009]